MIESEKTFPYVDLDNPRVTQEGLAYFCPCGDYHPEYLKNFYPMVQYVLARYGWLELYWCPKNGKFYKNIQVNVNDIPKWIDFVKRPLKPSNKVSMPRSR